MPLSHLGITLPGLYDRSPIFGPASSGNAGQSDGQGGSSSYGDQRGLTAAPGCTGICTAQGRRCHQCQGAPAAPISQTSGPSYSGGSLFSRSHASAGIGAGQDSQSPGFTSSALYSASASGSTLSPRQASYQSPNYSRSVSSSSLAPASADSRGQQPSLGANARLVYSQQPSLNRAPPGPSYDVSQSRGSPTTAYPSGIPTMQGWHTKDQGAVPFINVAGYPQENTPSSFQPWSGLGAPQGSIEGSVSTESSLPPSSSSSSNSTSPQQYQPNTRYIEYPGSSSSGSSSLPSTYHPRSLEGSATNPTVTIPDLLSPSPWFSEAVQARDTYTTPVSSSMEYYPPQSDRMYLQPHNSQQYLSPSQFGGQMPSGVAAAAGSVPGTAFGAVNDVSAMGGAGNSSTDTVSSGYQGWAGVEGFHHPGPGIVSPSGRSLLHSPSSEGAEELMGSRRSDYDNDDARWEGVANRSHHADRYYLYGASTTHIYCRPSCASKRPTRDRVQFFPHPNAAAAAEAAGYRSCRRCKPDRSGGGDQTVVAVGECVRHMMMAATNSAEEGGEPKKKTLKEYAARAGLSTFHFHRSLAKVMSITPGEFSKACQSLALQNALGMDSAPPGAGRITSRMYDAALAGWSSRRAKRALGNVEPSAYASGDALQNIVRTSVRGTEWGNISIVYTSPAGPGVTTVSGATSPSILRTPPKSQHPSDRRPSLSPLSGGHGQSTNGDRVLLALMISPDAEQRLTIRFPAAVIGDGAAQEELRTLVTSLVQTGVREEQLPSETVPSIRRARLWAATRLRLTASGGGGGGAGGGSGGGAGSSGSFGDHSAGRLSGSSSAGEHAAVVRRATGQMMPVPLDGP